MVATYNFGSVYTSPNENFENSYPLIHTKKLNILCVFHVNNLLFIKLCVQTDKAQPRPNGLQWEKTCHQRFRPHKAQTSLLSYRD